MTERVYLISSEVSTLVKIGRSVDVQARLAAIQYMSPVPLVVLWQTVGGAELETALHRWFSMRRSHGEWFDFPDGDAVEQVMHALAEIATAMQRRKQHAQVSRAWMMPSPHRQAIMRLAIDGVSNRQVVKRLGISSATAHRYLSALGAEGVIKMRGRGRAASWCVTCRTNDASEIDAE